TWINCGIKVVFMLLDWPEGINSTSKQTVYSLSGCTAGQGCGNGVRGRSSSSVLNWGYDRPSYFPIRTRVCFVLFI
ncbi:hypothetical protein, partial [Pararcticibacter amylolyticus]|uniref:hypothetical protein n=1 Tax=Pararcticibacter amylolyticus TaxID=2173175 RepID=UPI001EE44311